MDVDCPDDNNECTLDGECNPEDGSCFYPPVEDGASCGGGAGTCGQSACRVPCDEKGIRDAVEVGGGPYVFACEGPTTLTTATDIVLDKDVILDGGGDITLDGDQTHRLFSVLSEATAELRGFLLTGGMSNPMQGPFDDGGAIQNRGSLTITETTVSGNMAQFGGGIGNNGFLTLVDSTVSGNTALAPSRRGRGGGISNTGFVTLTNSTVSGNSANQSGGGISSTGSVRLEGSTVSGNSAFVRGGGIDSDPGGTVVAIDSTISDNVAAVQDGESFGGGIGASGGMVVLTNSTVSGNTATTGGGGISFTGTLMLSNSTVSGNTAGPAGGGGLFNGVESAVLTLISSTVADNSATDGGSAIVNEGTATLTNTVIAGSCSGGGSVDSGGHNVESPGNTCGLSPSDDIVEVSASELSLGPLVDNGGPTLTQSPLTDSVAIDAVPTEDCVDSEGLPLETDQRGIPRPQGSACDTGAVEVE